MKMDYTLGDTVIISVFDKHKVGKVVETALVKAGQRYIIKTEDGRTYDDVYVDFNEGADSYINSALTKSFLKSQ